jgi:transposase
LRWCDAPKEDGPARTLYNRWKRWSDNGVFARIMVGLASESAQQKTSMIDATYPQGAPHGIEPLRKKGERDARLGAQKVA